MQTTDLQEKIEALRSENNDRAEKVKQARSQMAQLEAAINSIKEEHDHTRGKIDMLNELLTQRAEEAPVDA